MQKQNNGLKSRNQTISYIDLPKTQTVAKSKVPGFWSRSGLNSNTKFQKITEIKVQKAEAHEFLRFN